MSSEHPNPANQAPGAPAHAAPGVRVCWIFSLARCGSSVAAYGAAAPWKIPVADEVFGPWDRTAKPYQYPPQQRELRDLFWAESEILSPKVLAKSDELFSILGEDAGRVVMKHPHASIRPADLMRKRPGHRAIILLRNPLKRLNSLYAREWFKAIGKDHDIHRFKRVAERWLDWPHRLRYEDLREDPREFFRRIWRAWEWDFTEQDVDAAIAYQKSHYHDSSLKLSDENPDAVLSDRKNCLTEEMVSLYLKEPFVREVMTEAGWSLNEADYL